MIPKIIHQLAPHARQMAEGATLGCGAVALLTVNAKAAIVASKLQDFDGKEDSFEQKNVSDVYSGTAAIVSTRAVLSLKDMPLPRRVGMSIPVAIGCGVGAKWMYEKSGELGKTVVQALKGLL